MIILELKGVFHIEYFSVFTVLFASVRGMIRVRSQVHKKIKQTFHI